MGLQDLRGQATRRTPKEMVKHLKTFDLDLKFSAGIWVLFSRRRNAFTIATRRRCPLPDGWKSPRS